MLSNYNSSQRTGILEIFPEYQDGLNSIVIDQTIMYFSDLTNPTGIFVRFIRGERNQYLDATPVIDTKKKIS